MKIIKRFGYRKPTPKAGAQYSITVPQEIIKQMGITQEDREVVLSYNEKTKEITIKKND